MFFKSYPQRIVSSNFFKFTCRSVGVVPCVRGMLHRLYFDLKVIMRERVMRVRMLKNGQRSVTQTKTLLLSLFTALKPNIVALIRNLPKFTSSVWFLVVITDENGHLSQMLNYDNLNNKITVPIYCFTLVSSRSMNVKIFHLTFPRFPSRFVHRTGTYILKPTRFEMNGKPKERAMSRFYCFNVGLLKDATIT